MSNFEVALSCIILIYNGFVYFSFCGWHVPWYEVPGSISGGNVEFLFKSHLLFNSVLVLVQSLSGKVDFPLLYFLSSPHIP